jgi:hypothetical protein
METINNFITKSISGDLRQGGTVVTGTVDGDTDALQFGDHIRLIGKSLAGFDDLDYREFFNGHVLETPDFSFDPFSSQASIRLGTANELMRGGTLQDIGFTEQASPANDHQIAPTMRISALFTHVMEHHCNFIFHATRAPDGIIFNVDIDTSDTAVTRLNVHKDNNFWNALVNKLGGGEEGGVQFYRPYFRRNNDLVYQPAAPFQSSPPASKGTLTKEHLRGRVRVNIRNARSQERTGQVNIVAVAGDNDFYEAKFPTTTPGDGRIIVKDRGIWADSQARADVLAQNVYDWLTRPYTLNVEVDPGLILFGDDGIGLNIGDKIQVTYDGPAEDAITGAGVHLDLSSAVFWVYKYNVAYDVNTRSAKGSLELEADN